MSNQQTGFQPLVCKKCGQGGLYHPSVNDNIEPWERIDKFGNVQAFEPEFNVPHWYICSVNPQGKEHRQKRLEKMTQDQQELVLQKERERLEKKSPLPYGQKVLPSEKLTDIDRSITEKVHVIELLLDEIKKLLAQKAAD
jgi:hypothetical protein